LSDTSSNLPLGSCLNNVLPKTTSSYWTPSAYAKRALTAVYICTSRRLDDINPGTV